MAGIDEEKVETLVADKSNWRSMLALLASQCLSCQGGGGGGGHYDANE